MNTIHSTAMEVADALEAKNFEIVRMHFDVLTTDRPNEIISRTFSSQYTYYISAFSDEAIPDLDIYIVEGDSEATYSIVTKDDSESNVAKVYFKPEPSTKYSIYIDANRFAGDEIAGYYGLIVTHDLPEISSPGSSNGSSNETGTLIIESTNRTIGRLSADQELKVISNDALQSRFEFLDGRIIHYISGRSVVYTVTNYQSKDAIQTISVTGPDNKEYVIVISFEEDVILINQTSSNRIYGYNIARSYKE